VWTRVLFEAYTKLLHRLIRSVLNQCLLFHFLPRAGGEEVGFCMPRNGLKENIKRNFFI